MILTIAEEIPQYNKEVIEAIEEAKILSKDPSTKRYNSFQEVLKDIENINIKDNTLT